MVAAVEETLGFLHICIHEESISTNNPVEESMLRRSSSTKTPLDEDSIGRRLCMDEE
ncbi:hypothetical protein HanIR_Chr07g0300181 [Helianthus annuus]|nr:hypothetical protein HanIR_Chr07g0300181 [Helianthus annuus]